VAQESSETAASTAVDKLKRRGLVAGLAGLAAAILAKATDRGGEVAYAADTTVDGNLIFTNPGQNSFRDIHTTGNGSGLRFYNNDTLTVVPAGAAIQFWGNGSALTGQAFIDSGAHDQAAVIFRTAPTGSTIIERFRIDAFGNTTINGNLSVGGTKAFVMDHPQDPANKFLYHSAVEAPEQINIYSGTVTTDVGGEATVQLPGYLEALNKDFRYQLTVIGQFANAIVASKIQNNRFTIKTDKPRVEVCWEVSGVRGDAYAKKHPFQPEQAKSQSERGYYLHPELYGQPQTKALEYSRRPGR